MQMAKKSALQKIESTPVQKKVFLALVLATLFSAMFFFFSLDPRNLRSHFLGTFWGLSKRDHDSVGPPHINHCLRACNILSPELNGPRKRYGRVHLTLPPVRCTESAWLPDTSFSAGH